MRVRLDLDLDAKTMSYSWLAVNDPTNLSKQGSSGPHTYSVTYEPDTLHMYWNASGGTGLYDNVVIGVVPEPTSFVLLSFGTLALACFRRRRRNM